MKTRITMHVARQSAGISLVTILLFSFFPFSSANAFCGFYVAKADASLFNKTSQVIIARNGDNTTLTMSSDFEGDITDFAMVVPVPVVLRRDQIRTVNAQIFKTLDDYSAPRLAEYYDQHPCAPVVEYDMAIPLMSLSENAVTKSEAGDSKRYTVKIEAQYQVDEYDILILSAKESTGLEQWLIDNGYKIPSGAREVLQPYLNSGMKFFVVKVNMEELNKRQTRFLSPLQISFNSPKFMLPIRLGMANAKGTQDMIVYAFSSKGRIETTNYRTVEVPSNNEIPEFVANYFGKFYVDVYRKHRNSRGHNNVYTEYAWDLSGYNYVKCDPCVGTPPILVDLLTAGVNWVGQNDRGGYDGNVYFTRLHVTYDRKNFPQDLMFEETPNKQNFQARYVIRHPVYDVYDCSEGQQYVNGVMDRRKKELNELAMLTGWDVSIYNGYLSRFDAYTPKQEPKYKVIKNEPQEKSELSQEEKLPALKEEITDSSAIEQEMFNTPHYGDDNDSNSSGSLKILVISVMLLLVSLTIAARFGRNKSELVVAKKE